MTDYKCFDCDKKISGSYVKKKVRCIYCGSKIIYKERSLPTKVSAR